MGLDTSEMNPYLPEKGPIGLSPSVFVFLDILGYQDLIASMSAEGGSTKVLRELHSALRQGRQMLDGNFTGQFGSKKFSHLKAFTDNIVVGWPIEDDAEAEFGVAFGRLAHFQLHMVLNGYFIRGAISVGNAFIDEFVVFGEALTEAYIGESKSARDPRIILTNSAVEIAKSHLQYYSNAESAPHSKDILKDADGKWFLNYLQCIVNDFNYDEINLDVLDQHKQAVENKLQSHRNNPAIWSKYSWVAGYHNYFCLSHPEMVSDDYLINRSEFEMGPALIS